MNCTEYDYLYNGIITHSSTTTQLFWIVLSSFSLLFSILMITVGEKVFRPASALIAGVFGLFLGYMITTEIGDVKCFIKLTVSAGFSLVLSILVLCIMKAGFFLLGGAAFGAVSHYLFEIFPKNELPNSVFQNKNGLYWIVVACSSLVGAILSIVFKKKFLRLATSMIGGSGISFSVYVLCFEILKPPVYIHSAIFLAITIFFSLFGYLFQKYYNPKMLRRENREDVRQVNKIDRKYILDLIKETQRDAQNTAELDILRVIEKNNIRKNIGLINP